VPRQTPKDWTHTTGMYPRVRLAWYASPRCTVSVESMLSQAILVVLDDYYAAMNRHDIDGIADVVTDDVIVHDDLFVDHVVRGMAEFRPVLEGLWKAVPDLTIAEMHDPFLAEGAPRCAVHGRMTGTLVDEYPHFGWTRVGGSIDVEYMAVYEIAIDRISYIRLCLNPTITARQVCDPALAARQVNAA
jgi:SnoaL-like domain